MYELRFRQIHLDFHTSPKIEGIGAAFDERHWQDTLRRGHVDSVTAFAKCHHGWSYHPTEVGRMHPHLDFDLLRAQMDASKAIDVNVPIYVSAGVDNVASYDHPEWRTVDVAGRYVGWTRDVTEAGFHTMCFNSPYMDYLDAQIREVVRLFPEANGIFLDIIHQPPCCCRWCLEVMEREGLDAEVDEDRRRCAQLALARYYEVSTGACRCEDADMPVFHNSGHISRGQRENLKYFSHLELESLPTGGWGYDHFPVSAKYCNNLGLDVMGMTGKFHTTWGEFGGFKHPNALRYECAAMLAFGAKCSVGDQLHPAGGLDESTYDIIGAAYSEVEAKEPWCRGTVNVADIGLLSAAALRPGPGRDDAADTGASRILLEGHFLFDILDAEMDFSRYRMLVLPDEIAIDAGLKGKLDAYLAGGGKLFLTGASGLGEDGRFAFDVGADCEGPGPCEPDYLLPIEELRPSFTASPLVMYLQAQRIKATSGLSLGATYDSYFNRSFRHFSSHQHTPNRLTPSGYDAGVRHGNILYLAHPVFSIYAGWGAVAYREYITSALRLLLDAPTASTNLPSTARLSLMDQPGENRSVLHLLYANTISRGGAVNLTLGVVREGRSVEVIEDLLPLHDVEVRLRLPQPVSRASLEPQGVDLPVATDGDETILRLSSFSCHQMVALHR